jgi:GDP/UDP-N,N'-diacetylbacillosamine 2-epimerase (hydrolysing)
VGPSKQLKIGVLTSSRADFGIYLPLLRKIRDAEDEFQLTLIAFGTHLSKYHGYTRDEMSDRGFEPHFEVASMLSNDRPQDIATAYALTALKFADLWSQHSNDFDWVLCLGDRFEMAAAVAAGIPFGIKFAHIHGGETTLGAIDNIYRHSITLASKLHFLSALPFKQKIKELTGSDEHAVVTGSLSLDNLDEIELLSKEAFEKQWHIDMSKPSLLITIHPETVAFEKNEHFVNQCRKAFDVLAKSFQLVVTMPNADTHGTLFRNLFHKLKSEHPESVYLIENFGTQSYFSCMQHAVLMIGNTSRGIVEAASFGKFVIDLGDRQKGRLCGENVIHIPFDAELMIEKVSQHAGLVYEGGNIYKLANAADLILQRLKSE